MVGISETARLSAGLSMAIGESQASQMGLDSTSAQGLAVTNVMDSSNGSAYNLSIGNNAEFQTYNSKGELGAAVVNSTLNTMNSGQFTRGGGGLGVAQRASYQFGKDVLGSYYGG